MVHLLVVEKSQFLSLVGLEILGPVEMVEVGWLEGLLGVGDLPDLQAGLVMVKVHGFEKWLEMARVGARPLLVGPLLPGEMGASGFGPGFWAWVHLGLDQAGLGPGLRAGVHQGLGQAGLGPGLWAGVQGLVVVGGLLTKGA